MPFLLILYLLTRLYNLSLLPIFFDESIWIYWSKVIATTNSHYFFALTNGKMPLLTWMIAFFLKLLPSPDYLIAGRLPSVIGGAVALIGIYKLSSLFLSSQKAGYLAAFLYILSPFTLFYDRLALFDSLLSAFLIWSAYFAIRTSRSLTNRDGLFWGLSLGLAFLFKVSALIYWLLTPIFLVLNTAPSTKNLWKKILYLSLLVMLISQLLNNSIIVSRGYKEYLIKSLDYTPGASHLLTSPFPLLWKNLQLSSHWLVSYHTWPPLLFEVLGLLLLTIKDRRKGATLALLIFAPVFVFSFFGKIFFPRYLLFTTPYFLIAASYLLLVIFERFQAHKIPLIIFLATLLFSLINFDFLLLTNPPKAPLPESERRQYITGFPSSYGFDPVYAYLYEDQKRHPITLVVQGSFSHFPWAFNLKFWGNNRIKIIERWPLDTIDNEIISATRSSSVYFVVRHNEADDKSDILKTFPFEIIVEGRKPGGKDSVYLTKLAFLSTDGN